MYLLKFNGEANILLIKVWNLQINIDKLFILDSRKN